MDLLQRIDIVLQDEISTGDVAVNTAKGHIDVIGGECPKGMVYDKSKKVCVPSSNVKESSVSAAVAGSGQTRVWGERHGWMLDLDRKEPVEVETADKAEQNISGRKGLQFNTLLGSYVPHGDTKVEPRYIDLIKGEIG